MITHNGSAIDWNFDSFHVWKVQWNKLEIKAHFADARSSSCSAVHRHLFGAASNVLLFVATALHAWVEMVCTKNTQNICKWIHCLLVWQWFKMFIQNMQMRSNKQENKRPRKDRKADAPESACFLQDPRPSILCAGASERIWWRPTCEVNVHLRAKESQGEPKTRLDWLGFNHLKSDSKLSWDIVNKSE